VGRRALSSERKDSFFGDEVLLGKTIDNRYLVEKRLGEGGMGVVYLARHVVLNKSVAIKVLRKAHDEAAWKRFVQEAQSASSVNHNNVVGISDFGVISGHAYLVMEYLDGETLTDLVNRGPTDALRVARIGAQIARGLQAVHEKGVVHRDLKPDNIFLVEREGKRDVVKIVDFGLAKMEAGQRLTQDGTVVGTAEYISPEQVTGQDTDARSDQYSLGCILYELLTAQLPFEGESTATLIYKHVYKSPKAPRKVRPEMKIPPSLEAVVLKCMAKKPADRFASMAALEQALLTEELQLSPKTSGGTEALIPRSHPSLERPWLYWGGIGGGVAAILVLAFILLTRPPAPPTTNPLPGRADLQPILPALPPKLPDLGTPVKSADPATQTARDLGQSARRDLGADEGSDDPADAGADDAGSGESTDGGENGGENGGETPGKGETDKPSSKPRSARSVSVRFSIEPKAAPASIACKRSKASCRGSCSLSVPEGASCTVSAAGYVSKVLRFRELKSERGKRSVKVTLSPVKLKLK
jgi:serine/threonine-protein kinase